jgi:hypothetical protein
MIFLFLSNLCFVLCCQNNSSFEDDPVLYSFIIGQPFCLFDTSKTVCVERIEYKNTATGEIDYGDNPVGTRTMIVYYFRERRLEKIITRSIYNGKERIIQKIDLKYHKNGLTIVNTTSTNTTEQADYTFTDNNLVISNGSDGYIIGAVIKRDKNRISYFSSLKRYNLFPDRPERIVEKREDGDIVISTYRGGKSLFSRYSYKDGLLMEIEYSDGRILQYSTETGGGDLTEKDIKGTLLRVHKLDRKIDTHGYLNYEKVFYDSGKGYELIITYE